MGGGRDIGQAWVMDDGSHAGTALRRNIKMTYGGVRVVLVIAYLCENKRDLRGWCVRR